MNFAENFWVSKIKRFTVLLIGAILIQSSHAGISAAADDSYCLENSLAYCVTSTSDDPPSPESGAMTLRIAVELANVSETKTVRFSESLFIESPIVTIYLDSPLEINSNIVISGPKDDNGNPLITLERRRGDGSSDHPMSGTIIEIRPISTGATSDLDISTTTVRLENLVLDGGAISPLTVLESGIDYFPVLASPTIVVYPVEILENPEEGLVPTLNLDNVTIQNSSSFGTGAAIDSAGDVVINNSNLLRNTSSCSAGGAIRAEGAVSVNNSNFVMNLSIDLESVSDSMSQCLLEFPVEMYSVLYTQESNGGAIYSAETVTVTDSLFDANYTTGDGGAIRASSVQIARSNFSSNISIFGNGGAVYTREGETSTVISSRFFGNLAPSGDGSAFSGDGLLILNTFAINPEIARDASDTSTAIFFASFDSPEGSGLYGNLISGYPDVCFSPVTHAAYNLMTDASCVIALENDNGTFEEFSDDFMNRADRHIPFDAVDEFLSTQLINESPEMAAFVSANIGIDLNGVVRPTSANWSVGAIQAAPPSVSVSDTTQAETPVSARVVQIDPVQAALELALRDEAAKAKADAKAKRAAMVAERRARIKALRERIRASIVQRESRLALSKISSLSSGN